MEITEVRIFLKDASPNTKLKAYAVVVFDNSFAIRNIKVIDGPRGIFIAMPSRKFKHPCPVCGHKNEMRSKFCNQCGRQLPLISKDAVSGSREPEHKDMAHPISSAFRETLQKKVLSAYWDEKKGRKK